MDWNLVELDTVDSTSSEVRRRALSGAPEGLAVTALAQTAGRGRQGRSFQSLAGKGLYLSVLLRPASARGLGELTPRSAVAACAALNALRPGGYGVKWVNDVVLNGKKLAGILTECALTPDGAPDFVVLGIGVNLSQTPADFGPGLSSIATSLGGAVDREALLHALLGELGAMYRAFPGGHGLWLERYRRLCVTTGRAVTLVQGDRRREAYAEAVNDDFSLLVRLPDGSLEAVTSGEVSVRTPAGEYL